MEEIKTTEKTEKDTGGHNIYLSEIWHTFISNIIWEALIFIVILVVALSSATTVPPSYYASTQLYVKVIHTGSDSDKVDLTLAERYLETVNSIFSMQNVRQLLNDQQYEKDETRFNGSISCDIGSGTFVTVTYTLPHNDAKTAAETISQAKTELYKFIIRLNEYLDTSEFSDDIVLIDAANHDGKQETKYYSGGINSSQQTNVRVIGVALAFAGVIIYLILAMLIGDKISSADRLERISGKKNLISIGKIKTTNGKKPTGDSTFISLKLGKLSDTLIFMQDGDKKKVYQIQSTHAGEGKTTICCNLAKALGKSERKVLIIDCDFAHPTVHKFLNMRKHLGISDYAKGSKTFEEIIKPTAISNVDLITCGDTITNHTFMFTSKKFEQLILEAREKYDFVLVDCAPVKAMSDYINISQLVDGTLLVVESDKVKAKDLKYAVGELEECGANVIGTVFNCSRSAFAKEYYYYYGKKKKYYYNNDSEEGESDAIISEENTQTEIPAELPTNDGDVQE